MMETELEMAKEFEILFKPKRTKVFYGGRGGLKSWGFAQALTVRGYMSPQRVLCARELQNSIRESVHRLLSDTIDRAGYDYFYDINVSNILGKNGSEFIFSGIKNNTAKVKSYEGLDVVWLEEAENITEESLDIIIPTIRKAGSEVWISFNPYDEQDAVYQRYVAPYIDQINKEGFYEDEHLYVKKIGWQDAEALGWFPAELRAEMEKTKEQNYNKYLHIWMGQPNVDYEDSIIDPKWVEASIDAHIKLGFKAKGAKVMGFDPADSGKDDKAYCIRHGSVVTHCESWIKGDLEEATAKAYEMAWHERCVALVYDNIGVGVGAKIKFNSLTDGSIDIVGFNGGGDVDNPSKKYQEDRRNVDIFRNARAQKVWELRDRFEKTYRAVEHGEYYDPDEMISLDSTMPELRKLVAEISRIQRKRGNTWLQVESKDDIRRDGRKSPGLFDSCYYAFANKPIKGKNRQPIQYDNRRVM